MNLWVHVLSKMLWKFVKTKRSQRYFGNFFSSYSLICDLGTKGFRATGTIRNDRIMKCPLVDVKKNEEKTEGSFNFRSDGNIEIVRWNDNSVVKIGNNAYDLQPTASAKRWIKASKYLYFDGKRKRETKHSATHR